MASPEDASLSLEADIPEGKVTLVSKDDQTFPNVDKQHASMSKLVLNVLLVDPHADAIPILGVEAAVLRLVVDYMQHHKSQPIATIATPLRGTDLSTLTSAFDAKLMMDCASDHLVFDIIDAANYMEIPRLVELGQAKVASLLKGRPLHEMQDVLTTLAGRQGEGKEGKAPPTAAGPVSFTELGARMSQLLQEHTPLIPDLCRPIVKFFGTPDFVMVFRVDSGDRGVELPLHDHFNVHVSWGDGSSGDYDSASDSKAATHTFAAPGLYTVRISGHMSGFGFGQPDGDGGFDEHKDGNKLVDIVQWGCVRFGNRGGYFCHCKNLGRLSARDLPDLTGVTNMRSMFYEASAFRLPAHAPWYTSEQTKEGCVVS